MRCLRSLLPILASLALARAASTQCLLQKLTPPELECSDQLGAAVAIDGDWAVAGMGDDDDGGFDQSGAVFTYQRVGTAWVQMQKVKAADAAVGDYLGAAVDISGTVLVAGAPYSDSPGAGAGGAAYVFELAGSTWTQTAKLVASDTTTGAFFGSSVAVRGDRILVGAPADPGPGDMAGAAYVFDRVGSSWVQTAKLTADQRLTNDRFGMSVALSGDHALVGAVGKQGPAGHDQGAAYLFQDIAGVWTQTQVLFASDGAVNDGLGWRVAIQDGTAVVSTTLHTHAVPTQGAAYVFADTGSGWVQTDELFASDASPSMDFGAGLSLSGEHLLIGADNDFGTFDTFGSAYLYRSIGSTWTRVAKLLPWDGKAGDVFGLSVGLSGNFAITGAFGVDGVDPSNGLCNSGAAYLFEIAPTGMQYGSCWMSSPCGNGDKHGGCKNSTGQGAILGVCGTGSVATDDLRIRATHVPPNKLTLLFMAPHQVFVPFGDGIRVVQAGGGVGLYRLGGLAADAQGLVTRGPGIVAQTQHLPAPGRIQAGQTWNFQIWYRDTQGPCHSGTNFTNGVQVGFVP